MNINYSLINGISSRCVVSAYWLIDWSLDYESDYKRCLEFARET